jgi:hypothetical protein
MAKKKGTTRRVPHSATPRTFGDGRPSVAAQATAEAVSPARPATTAPQTSVVTRRSASIRSGEARAQVPLAQEYHYIVPDLRRLAILAVSTFAVLIVLGLVIR